MTQRFLKAMPYIFEHEGGFNSTVGDNGGATSFGISLVFLKSINDDINHDGHVDWLDIKSLTKDQAEELYWDNFWKPLYDKVTERLGIKMFDVAVNAGNSRSNKLLQTALNKLGSKLMVDGVIGQTTFGEAAKYSEDSILAAYCQSQKEFYEGIVKANPTQAKFLKGWTNRSQWLPK